ncbi:MAG: peptidylprolyl isomerase [Spirochaetales bacterium]|nr:peptidylprolyl isomerase [Spirochaetales bacterium]
MVILLVCVFCVVQLFAADLSDGLYAVISTAKGDIVVRLEYEKAPLTVMNFIGLAEGTLPNSFRSGKPFYDGLTFHRVVDGFVIQGGDPKGNGTGGPGYNFPDEFHPDLRHNAEGILSMANSGPNTNGSQFFITLSVTSATHLDGKHSVFGKVVSGMNVVRAIKQGDAIQSVTIKRIGPAAAKFVCNQASFDRLVKKVRADAEAAEQNRTKKEQEMAKTYIKDAQKSSSGMYYAITEPGHGENLKAGDTAVIDYTGKLLSGTVFDSTRGRGPLQIVYGNQRLLPGLDEILSMLKAGGKARIVLPPELAFGQQGYPGVIPGNSFVYYEIELVEIH